MQPAESTLSNYDATKRHRAFDPEKAGYEGCRQGAVALSLASHQRDGERSGRKLKLTNLPV